MKIADMYRECSYPRDGHSALAASDTCRTLASSAVQVGDRLMWRCGQHEGMISAAERGPVFHEIAL